TTLENRVMPLVRYEIGDYAVATDQTCDCGRTLPLVGRIVGRGVNLFVDADRKRFVPWDLFRPLKDREWVKQYQVVQRGISHFRVRFVSERPFGPQDESDVSDHFKRILDHVPTIEFERVDKIARAPSGKFMTALCEIPQSAEQA